MRPPPAFDCAACERTIGKTRGHYLTDDDRVLCAWCVETRHTHGELWPDCPVPWHDPFDHLRAGVGTRAGVAALLGLWPDSPDETEERHR